MAVAIILLASGNSRRFGANKLLQNIDGKPMYRHISDAVDSLTLPFLSEKLVVTQYPEIGTELRSKGYQVIYNQQSILGISHSIQLALNRLTSCRENETSLGVMPKAQISGYCFAVCDQPYLTARTLHRLLEGWNRSGKGLGCLAYGSELGNPGIFSGRYLDELMDLQGDTGGKSVIKRHLEDLYVCQANNEWELKDMDEKLLYKTQGE